MSGSTSLNPQVLEGTGAVSQINENFDSVSPAATGSRNPDTSGLLVWGYIGGRVSGASLANGTVTLTASTTNYIVMAKSGLAVSASTATTNWNDGTNYWRLYSVDTNATAAATWIDERFGTAGLFPVSSGVVMTNPMTTTGDIIYSSSGSTPARLGVGTNGYVLTLAAGVPTWAAATGGFSNPMTTSGDLILGGVSGAAGRLGIGSDGHVLTVTAGAVGWAASASGFANPMTTAGDIITGASGGTAQRVAAGTNGYVLTMVSGTPAWAAAAGGGSLTNWTEAANSAAPNNVIPVVSFTATNAATNVDAALIPKGTGSILANLPDSASTGGNKRGTRAVDLQLERSAAAQVASGTNAVIGGGRNNTSLQSYGTVSGGDGNAVNGAGSRSAIGGGGGNTASGSYSTIPGGLNCVASSNYTHAFGSTCTASADYSQAGGFTCTADGVGSRAHGQFAIVRGLRGADSFAGGRRTASGDAQRRSVMLFRTTTDGSATQLTTDGAAPGSSNQLNLPSALAFKVRGQVIAMRSDGSVSAWDVSFIAKRVGTTTSIVGTPTITNVGNDGTATGYALAIAADDTNDVVQITATGTAGHTAYWVAELTSLEVG